MKCMYDADRQDLYITEDQSHICSYKMSRGNYVRDIPSASDEQNTAIEIYKYNLISVIDACIISYLLACISENYFFTKDVTFSINQLAKQVFSIERPASFQIGAIKTSLIKISNSRLHIYDEDKMTSLPYYIYCINEFSMYIEDDRTIKSSATDKVSVTFSNSFIEDIKRNYPGFMDLFFLRKYSYATWRIAYYLQNKRYEKNTSQVLLLVHTVQNLMENGVQEMTDNMPKLGPGFSGPINLCSVE